MTSESVAKLLEQIPERDHLIWSLVRGEVSTGNSVVDAVIVDGGLDETGSLDPYRLQKYNEIAERIKDKVGEPVVLAGKGSDGRTTIIDVSYGFLESDTLRPYNHEAYPDASGRAEHSQHVIVASIPTKQQASFSLNMDYGDHSFSVGQWVEKRLGGIRMKSAAYDYDYGKRLPPLETGGIDWSVAFLVGYEQIGSWITSYGINSPGFRMYWFMRKAALAMGEKPIDLSDQFSELLEAEREVIQQHIQHHQGLLNTDQSLHTQLAAWKLEFENGRNKYHKQRSQLANPMGIPTFGSERRTWPFMDLDDYKLESRHLQHVLDELKDEVKQEQGQVDRLTEYAQELGIEL